MASPFIFISHTTVERDVAIALKIAFEELFPNGEIFVSNPAITGGTGWFENIRSTLVKADVILLSVTELSQSDPWILFEAGAGLEQQKSIPVIWGKMTFSSLKFPLAGLQGRRIDEESEFKKLLDDITKHSKQLRSPWNSDSFTSLKNAISKHLKSHKENKSHSKSSVQKVAYDPNSLALWQKATKICSELVIEKLESSRTIHPDIPAKIELEKMSFADVMTVVDLFSTFSPMEKMSLMMMNIASVPKTSDHEVKKKKAERDLTELIETFQRMATKYRINLTTT